MTQLRRRTVEIQQLQLHRKKLSYIKTDPMQNSSSSNSLFQSNESNFIKVDNFRISRYMNKSQSPTREESKWENKISQYMSSKKKMSEIVNRSKISTQFDELPLNKRFQLQKKKIVDEVFPPKCPKDHEKSEGEVECSERKVRINQNKKLAEKSEKKTLRCDALMVNYVSNYFRRKMYKKHRRYDSKRIKTDMSELVNLQGYQIE